MNSEELRSLREANEERVMSTTDRFFQIYLKIMFFLFLGLVIMSIVVARERAIAIVFFGVLSLVAAAWVEKKAVEPFKNHPPALCEIPSALYQLIRG